jgi:hypothetical protein
MQIVSCIFAVKYSCCWYNAVLVTSDAYYPQCIGVFHVPHVTNQMTNNFMHVTFVVCGPQLFDGSIFVFLQKSYYNRSVRLIFRLSVRM